MKYRQLGEIIVNNFSLYTVGTHENFIYWRHTKFFLIHLSISIANKTLTCIFETDVHQIIFCQKIFVGFHDRKRKKL